MAPKEASNGVMEEEDVTASAAAEESPMDVDAAEGLGPSDGDGASAVSKVQANERLLFCAEVLIGYKCEVQVRRLRAAGSVRLALLVDGNPPAAVPAPSLGPHHVLLPCLLAQLVDGTIYEGIFHTMKVDGKDAHVVLKYAKVLKDPSITAEGLQAIAKKPEVVKVVHSDDIAAVVAKDVRMAPEDLGAEQQYDFGFETDAAISRGRGG